MARVSEFAGKSNSSTVDCRRAVRGDQANEPSAEDIRPPHYWRMYDRRVGHWRPGPSRSGLGHCLGAFLERKPDMKDPSPFESIVNASKRPWRGHMQNWAPLKYGETTASGLPATMSCTPLS